MAFTKVTVTLIVVLALITALLTVGGLEVATFGWVPSLRYLRLRFWWRLKQNFVSSLPAWVRVFLLPIEILVDTFFLCWGFLKSLSVMFFYFVFMPIVFWFVCILQTFRFLYQGFSYGFANVYRARFAKLRSFYIRKGINRAAIPELNWYATILLIQCPHVLRLQDGKWIQKYTFLEGVHKAMVGDICWDFAHIWRYYDVEQDVIVDVDELLKVNPNARDEQIPGRLSYLEHKVRNLSRFFNLKHKRQSPSVERATAVLEEIFSNDDDLRVVDPIAIDPDENVAWLHPTTDEILYGPMGDGPPWKNRQGDPGETGESSSGSFKPQKEPVKRISLIGDVKITEFLSPGWSSRKGKEVVE